jgi:hypothetical protein
MMPDFKGENENVDILYREITYIRDLDVLGPTNK